MSNNVSRYNVSRELGIMLVGIMLVSIMLVGKFVSNNGVLEYGVRARVLYGKLQGFLWFRV